MGAPLEGNAAPVSEKPKVYVVPTGRWGTGDIAGVSVTADRVWFQHVSSSLGWLVRDTTTGFGDRRLELEQAYPDGFEVVLVQPGDDLPAEIAHHFERSDDGNDPHAASAAKSSEPGVGLDGRPLGRSGDTEPGSDAVPHPDYQAGPWHSRCGECRAVLPNHMPSCSRIPGPAAAKLPPLGPLHVRQGVNNYEWHVYEGSVKLGTLSTQAEAVAFMDGYEKGWNRDV